MLLEFVILFGILIAQYNSNEISKINYFWQESSEWSPCSVTCGEGSQMKEIFCAIKMYNQLIKADQNLCDQLKKPNGQIKFCSKGYCPEKYEWKTYPWSKCSHSCGNLGFRYREVECSHNISKNNAIVVYEILCAKFSKPNTRLMCNRNNCPPEFVTGKWEKCVEGPECQPGNQKRQLKCSQMLKSGKVKILSRFKCFSRNKPVPPQWRKCYDFVNTPKCLKGIPPRKVEFSVINSSLYQMRKAKVVQLQIGQIGYLLPFGKITITCPVNNFPQHQIIWKHKNDTFVYIGKVSSRIYVDRYGQVKIRKLSFQDQGEWICKAQESEKSVIIKIRNPSAGFRDWAIRNNLWKKGMISEDSKNPTDNSNLIQWITSEWSVCSVTCSGEGLQYREVHCEKVEQRFYNVLDDSNCKKFTLPPNKMRSCYTSVDCPQWKLKQTNKSKCSNDCIHIGISILQADLSCSYINQDVPYYLCDDNKKPELSCKNDACDLDWRLSSWSKCSKRCGGTGFQARHITCVWKSTRKSAGSLCFQNKFLSPKVIRKCETSPCIMGCVDLSKHCVKDMKKCYYSLYRYLCCFTCQKYFNQTVTSKTI